MTISGTSTSITVDGDGLTSTFNYDFYMGGSSAYAVLVYTDADGVSITVDAADFTITGVTSQSGGTFTYPLVGSPIGASTTLTLSRVLPIVQNTAVSNQGNFYPSAVEGALDYLTMIAQQQEGGAAGTLDAESLFGNSQASSAAGASIPIGSGLSFSGGTLIVSGISGSGTVTQLNTTGGITGGPVTGVGTISLSTVTTGYVLANFSGATASPQGVLLVAGVGITLSSTTTSLTFSCSFSGAMATMTSDQTASDYTTAAAINFGAEQYDIGGWHSTATNSSRVTAISGVSWVEVWGQVGISSGTADTYRSLKIRQDGTTQLAAQDFIEGGNATCRLNVASGPVQVTGGTTYFELLLVQETDTSITVESANTWLKIRAIA